MVYQVPQDLIQQAQILLRKEAGVESYNPSLPVEDVIGRFDPSPDSVRCIYCKGNLLRSSQSLICVYCGRQVHREIPPDPISFKSTIGFRWLMESLSLDGSEIVEPSEEDRQMNRGRNYGKEEISLSDFLNVEMKWPAESERLGLTDTDELRIQKSSQLAGMSMIHTSSEKSEEAESSEKSTEFEAFPALGSHHLSENRELFDVKPSEVKHDDSFSVWEADFQAATPVAPHDSIESSQPLKIPSVDYSSHMDSVFGPVKDFEEGKLIHDAFSNVEDIVSVVPDHGAKLFDPDGLQMNQQQEWFLESDDSKMGGEHDGCKSATDMTSDGLTSSTSVSNINSDVWNEFASSAGSGVNRQQISRISAPQENDLVDAWNDFTGSGIVSDSQLASRGMNSAEEESGSVDNEIFGPWNDVTSLTNAQKSQQKESGEIAISTDPDKQKDSVVSCSDNSSLSDMGDKLQNTITSSTVDTINEKHDDSFDLFGSFMGTAVPQQGPGGQLNGEEGNDRADGWDGFMKLNKSSTSELNKTEGHGDKDTDSLESWNAFTGSACRPESKSINEDTAWAWSDISNQNMEREAVDQRAFGHKEVIQDEDSPSSWSEFTGSSNTLSNKVQASTSFNNVTSADLPKQIFEDFPSSMGIAGEEHTSRMELTETNEVKVDDVLNSWNGFPSSSGLLNNQWQTNAVGMSESDIMGLNSVPDITKTYENRDSFDSWSDFTSSSNLSGNERKNEITVDDKQAAVRDDPYDAWNLLMSSSSSQRNVASTDHAKETSLFYSPDNLKSTGLNSTLHSVMLPDAVSNQNGSANIDIASSETLDLFRIEEGKAESSIQAKQTWGFEDVRGQTSSKKPIDAEALISQMQEHDLSFMLDSSLSVPEKLE